MVLPEMFADIKSQIIIDNQVITTYKSHNAVSISPIYSSIPANTPRLTWGSRREDNKIISNLLTDKISFESIFKMIE